MSWYPAMSGRDASEVEVAEWAEELAGAASGYSSISFTTQSASVPDVEANRSTITSPATVRSRSRGGGVQVAKIGRAAGRGRVEISGGGGSFKKKKKENCVV